MKITNQNTRRDKMENCLVEDCIEICKHTDDIYCKEHLNKFAVMKLEL